MADYISLQGKFYLAPIVNGVAGAMRHIGNVPEFELEIDAEVLEHNESMTGQRSTDFTIVQTTAVNFSGQLEEINKENLEYILSGVTTASTSQTLTDVSIGTVEAGQEIKLDGYKLTDVTFKDSTASPVTIDPSDYTLDAKFGTVIFNDVSSLTMPILMTATTGAVSQTTLASDFEKEYALFFKGINTANGADVAVNLWRTKKSPSTTFPLIHEGLGQYEIEGQALADVSKESDTTLGLYGNVITIPKA